MPEAGEEMSRVVDLFKRWRISRTSQTCRIPDELWVEAVGLLRWYRLGEVAARLRLNATALREHAQAGSEGTGNGAVELPAMAVMSWPSADGNPGKGMGCAPWALPVEVEYGNGCRVRFEARGAHHLADVVSVLLRVGHEGARC